MIKIAYLIDHLQTGGAQRHLLEVVRRLDPERYSAEMWSVASDAGELAPEFERLGVPVRTLGVQTTLISPRTLATVRRTAKDLRQRGIHVVHGYLFEGNLFAALAGWLAGTPVTLVSKRSLDRYDRIDRWTAAWLSNRLAHRVLVNATAVRDLVIEHERCPAERVELIPNGVPLPAPGSQCAPSRREERAPGPLVGMVGRLGWKKGYQHALAAFARVRERIPEAQLDIVGDGSLRKQLQEQAHAAGLDGCVRFLGRRDDVPSLMQTFDCFALSSVIEGMPNALLEAMALGLPVVTTSAGGSAEVVVDGESGFVVPPADPTALAEAIARVLSDRGLASRLGRAAATRVREHFSVEAMLRALERLYTNELARAGLEVSFTPDTVAECHAGPAPVLGHPQ